MSDDYYQGGPWLPTPQQQFEMQRQALACENGLHDWDATPGLIDLNHWPPRCRYCGVVAKVVMAEKSKEGEDGED